MSSSEAPRVFVSYARDSPEHTDRVRLFARLLRAEIGLDVHLDQWYDARRHDWSAWTIDQLDNADFILAVASPSYRRSFDGTAQPYEDRRAQLEAARIRDHLTKDLRGGTEQVLPVVLPGQSAQDIPVFLSPHSTTTFHVEELSRTGVSALIAAITGYERYPLPERGRWQEGGADHLSSTMLLATDLPWLAGSPSIHAGVARIDGVDYENSLVLRPKSRTEETLGFVEIELDAAYRRMTSIVGVIDDAVEAFQVGQFQVDVDGETRHECRVSQGKAGMVDVDLTGAVRLRLEMYRPSAAGSPLGSGRPAAGNRSRRLPELAWGNPLLS